MKHDFCVKGLRISTENDPGIPSTLEICENRMTKRILCKERDLVVVRLAKPLVITQEQIDWAIIGTAATAGCE